MLQILYRDEHLIAINKPSGLLVHKSFYSGEADTYAIQELKKQGADDIIVFVGGVIPRQDYEFLYESGVKGIYGPGTPIPASAKDVLEQIRLAQK